MAVEQPAASVAADAAASAVGAKEAAFANRASGARRGRRAAVVANVLIAVALTATLGSAHAGGVGAIQVPSLPSINAGLSADCVAKLNSQLHGAEAALAAHRCARPRQPGDLPDPMMRAAKAAKAAKAVPASPAGAKATTETK